MTVDLIGRAGPRGRATLAALRVSYCADLDFLLAVVPGEVIDGLLHDETDVLAVHLVDELDEQEDANRRNRRGIAGPVMRETSEAAACRRRAIACEAEGSYQTDADERLVSLSRGTA